MQLSRKDSKTGSKKYTAPQVLINPNKSCIRIYTDGSCKVNPGGAGTWSFVIVENDTPIYEYGQNYRSTTNNRMELMAVMNAIEYINTQNVEQVVIYSDSQYVCNSIHNKKGKEANKNGDLLEQIKKLVANSPHIQYMWTQGHAGQKWNEYADELCRIMYSKVATPDTGYEGNNIHSVPVPDAKQFLLNSYLPTTSPEDRELWYKCSDWARSIVSIMEKYKQQ